ncbi:putative ABC transport system permease protein [Nocardioides sp. J9]|uniref:FtsX-like permease family protein n=1 Tax=Nocardioides sp. J9 TaxID=935844 RepID=UPI00119FF517|nr:ABC transporter permease [Nocardioides sp. J9]TWG95598.1 putative ABC transport system permease protein [Nocardioides sp. J9]
MPTPCSTGRLLAAAPEAGADAWLVGWTLQPLGHGGTVVDTSADVGQVPDRPDHRWQELVAGRFPASPGEALIDPNAAKADDIALGDRLRVGTGADALDVTVVGLADSPSSFSVASVYLLWSDLSRWQDELYVSSVAWSGGEGFGAARDAVRSVVPGAEPARVGAFVQELQTEVNNGVDVVAIIALLFATIALLVAVLVINNTFAILFAQRSRDFALLRCVGATRRQVLRSVRAESLALGVVAAVVGTGAGLVAGRGLVALVNDRWPEARLGAAAVSVPWLVVAAAVAVGVPLVAAWLPTRRVVQVSPLAALRPDDSTRLATAPGRTRVGLGMLLVLAGSAALAVAVAVAAPAFLVLGGAATFLGVLLLGPAVVPGALRAVSGLVGRAVGPAGRLAAGNAVRNPRRTAATTASLLIGVTLTTAVLTGLASSRTAVGDEMDAQHPVDLALTAPRPLPADLPARVRAVEDVAEAVPVPGAPATVAGEELPVLAPTRAADAVLHQALPQPRPRQVLVPWDLLGDDLVEGDLVDVVVGGRATTLRVRGGEGWGEAALVAPQTLARLSPAPGTQAVWVRAAEGADPEDLAGALEAIGGPVDAAVENGLARRAYVDLQLDVLGGGVVGLLAIAVVIALVGIANTLGLSVLERGREHALLRALGLTRRQVRRMLAVEAVLLSGVAALLGTALGVTYAWLGVQALVAPAVSGAALVLPWGQLGLVVALSAAAGLAAAVLPARRAARTAPAAGLALD